MQVEFYFNWVEIERNVVDGGFEVGIGVFLGDVWILMFVLGLGCGYVL